MKQRTKQNSRRSMERHMRQTAFYGVADEKFMRHSWTIDARRRRRRRRRRGRCFDDDWALLESQRCAVVPSRCSRSLARCRAQGLGSVKARDRLTGVQLAIFNDRCSTIPRRSPKSRDRSRSLHGNSIRSSELTNVMLPNGWTCAARLSAACL